MRRALICLAALLGACSGELKTTVTLELRAPCIATIAATLVTTFTSLPDGSVQKGSVPAGPYLLDGMSMPFTLPRNSTGFQLVVELDDSHGRRLGGATTENSVGATGNTDVPLTIGGPCLDAAPFPIHDMLGGVD